MNGSAKARCPEGRHRLRLATAPRVAVVASVILAAVLLVAPTALGAVLRPAVALSSVATGSPIVAVDGGSISGVVATQGAGWSFRGVPFAAPPVGDLRWRPPQAVIPWAGVRTCTLYGPVCPQKTLSTPSFVRPTAGLSSQQQSEDCLYLNVDTPSKTLKDHLPVMVWIYGGSFLSGSGSAPLYNGASLSRKGVVVVTLNYRLGPFGFFAHPKLTAESPDHSSGNYGLLDQIAALQWVQRNIDQFGGDPDNVTIFGESAGACSVLDLMSSPLTYGQHLFTKAISESAPNADNGIVIYSTRPLATGETMGANLSKALGCNGKPDELAALRNVSTATLLSVGNPQQRLFQTNAPYTYQPYVDGWVLDKDPVDSFATGTFRHVPLMIGSNREEANIGWPVVATQNVTNLQGPLSEIYGPYAQQLYALFPVKSPGGLKQSLLDCATLTVFTAPAQYFGKRAAATGQPVYNYLFTGRPFGWPLNACHTAELPYVFGNLYGFFDPTIGNAGTLTAAMQDYWTSFATSGDPNGDGHLRWPRYSADSSSTMILSPTSLSVVQGYQAKECAVADQLFVPALVGRDRIGPVPSARLTAIPWRVGPWRPGRLVTLTASDGARGSGVRSIQYQYRTSTGLSSWRTYRIPIAFGGAGTYRVAFRAVDRRGNVGVTRNITFSVPAVR